MAFGLFEGVMYLVHFMQQTFFRVLLTKQPKKTTRTICNISQLLFLLLFPCLSLSRLLIPLSLVMSSNVHPNCATSFLALFAPAIWPGKGQCNSVLPQMSTFQVHLPLLLFKIQLPLQLTLLKLFSYFISACLKIFLSTNFLRPFNTYTCLGKTYINL